MQIYFSVFVLMLTFTYIKSECCGTYRIEYDMKDGYPCNHIVGGSTNSGSGLHCQINVCYDGRQHEGTYCGIGPCNIFGCNCDGGCFRGNPAYPQNPYKNFMDNYSEYVERAHGGVTFDKNEESKESEEKVEKPEQQKQ